MEELSLDSILNGEEIDDLFADVPEKEEKASGGSAGEQKEP